MSTVSMMGQLQKLLDIVYMHIYPDINRRLAL